MNKCRVCRRSFYYLRRIFDCVLFDRECLVEELVSFSIHCSQNDKIFSIFIHFLVLSSDFLIFFNNRFENIRRFSEFSTVLVHFVSCWLLWLFFDFLSFGSYDSISIFLCLFLALMAQFWFFFCSFLPLFWSILCLFLAFLIPFQPIPTISWFFFGNIYEISLLISTLFVCIFLSSSDILRLLFTCFDVSA